MASEGGGFGYNYVKGLVLLVGSNGRRRSWISEAAKLKALVHAKLKNHSK